jgi:3-hydroxyacyl-[acyl-carrier-protein] dehydratase
MVESSATGLSARASIDPADPVFAGHYRGFPLLPGLFLVEYVNAAVRAATAAAGIRLVAVERAKFHRPVLPGDELAIEGALAADDGGLRCVATVSTVAGPVADMRLRYRGGDR